MNYYVLSLLKVPNFWELFIQSYLGLSLWAVSAGKIKEI